MAEIAAIACVASLSDRPDVLGSIIAQRLKLPFLLGVPRDVCTWRYPRSCPSLSFHFTNVEARVPGDSVMPPESRTTLPPPKTAFPAARRRSGPAPAAPRGSQAPLRQP